MSSGPDPWPSRAKAASNPIDRAERGAGRSPSRRGALAAIVVAGALVFALAVHQHHPIGAWLFFRYARAIALAALFSVTCLVAGHAVVVRLLRRVLPIEEHLTVAFSLGVFAFFLASLLFGFLGLYGWPFFFLGPALLTSLGARDFIRTAARFRRHAARNTSAYS